MKNNKTSLQKRNIIKIDLLTNNIFNKDIVLLKMSDHPNFGKVYIILEREFKDKKFNNKDEDYKIYKIGRTYKLNDEIFYQYPKGSILMRECNVQNSSMCEKEIAKLFAKQFKQRTDIGNEYFEGKFSDMDNFFALIVAKYKMNKNDNKDECTCENCGTTFTTIYNKRRHIDEGFCKILKDIKKKETTNKLQNYDQIKIEYDLLLEKNTSLEFKNNKLEIHVEKLEKNIENSEKNIEKLEKKIEKLEEKLDEANEYKEKYVNLLLQKHNKPEKMKIK